MKLPSFKSPFLEQQESEEKKAPPEATRIGGRPDPNSTGAVRGFPLDAPSQLPRKAFLVVVTGENEGRLYDLVAPTVVIGRGRDCDIDLDSDGVSRRHARLELRSGVWTLNDLGSTNGTWVDGAAAVNAPLTPGAHLRIGTDVVVRFELLDERAESDRRRLYEDGRTDPLTGLSNRRAFDDTLSSLVASVTRSESPLVLILVQIDDLRAVNDYYTRAGGDAFVRELAKYLADVAPAGGAVFRLASDAFALTSSNLESAAADALAERIRGGTERLEVLWQSGDFPMCIQQVTARLSITMLDEVSPPSASALVEAGTARLQRAQVAGGNIVITGRDDEH